MFLVPYNVQTAIRCPLERYEVFSAHANKILQTKS